MPETIVVVGRREKQNDGSYLIHFSTGTGVPGVRFLTPREVSPDGGGSAEPELEIAVKIEKTKVETDQAKLEDAARKLVTAAITVLTALEAANPTDFIVVLDRLTTIGEILETLRNTQFTVTDATNFGNNGVGTAQRGAAGGPNIDVINYEAIVGSSTRTGYADPGFSDNSGMNALVLHEVAHMTQAGYDFYQRSAAIARDDTTVSRNFYETEYATNLEAYASDAMTEASFKIGVDLHGVRPGPAAPAVTPETIYQSNNGHPYPG